jgi:hypothetical protein
LRGVNDIIDNLTPNEPRAEIDIGGYFHNVPAASCYDRALLAKSVASRMMAAPRFRKPDKAVAAAELPTATTPVERVHREIKGCIIGVRLSPGARLRHAQISSGAARALGARMRRRGLPLP